MSDIPPEIVADFLSLVPALSLLRFRCLSKSWRALIDSPDFIKMHLSRTIQTDRKLILRQYHTGPLHMVDFYALERTNKADCLKRPDIGTEIEILGSCHGLVCLENSEKDIVLWNPITRKHFKLPSSDSDLRKESAYGYGFGYDKVSDDYKVLRILQYRYSETDSRVEVFSMKSKCWRKILFFPYLLKYMRDKAVLAGGAFHWVVNRNQDSEMENLIVAFDLGTEEYRLVRKPDDFKKEFDTDVVVLGESLCLICNYYNSRRVDIWVMKKYAVKESWTKLFTVTESNFETKPFINLTPLAYSSCGHLVFMAQNGSLPLWYDLKNRKIRYSMYSSIGTDHHMSFGSLVQLDGGISTTVLGMLKEEREAKRWLHVKGFKLML